MIPAWLTLKVTLGLGIAALVVATLTGSYLHGKSEQARAQQVEQLKEDLRLQRKAAEAANTALSERVASAARIQTITKEIVREVPVRIPAGACALPDEWRVLHDAAAAGEAPAPTGGPDAAPTSPQEAADTVAENYGQYHDTADQLRKLQQWVREVSE